MSSSEASTSDSGIEASAQALSLRGGKRKVPFEPPQGAVLVGGPEDDAGAVEKGEFDWESIKDDKDVELWLVRIPNSVCPFVVSSLPSSRSSPQLCAPFRLVSIPRTLGPQTTHLDRTVA